MRHQVLKTEAELFSGQYFDIAAPKAHMVDVLDIAHALSNICRFNGQCSERYSVGEHSCVAHDIYLDHVGCVELTDILEQPIEVRQTAFAILMHDALETYVGDRSRPYKAALRQHCPAAADAMNALDAEVHQTICDAYGIANDADLHTIIKQYDDAALRAEAEELMASGGQDWHLPEADPDLFVNIRMLDPVAAKVAFLIRFSLYRPLEAKSVVQLAWATTCTTAADMFVRV